MSSKFSTTFLVAALTLSSVLGLGNGQLKAQSSDNRSEERRVGKEC